MVMVEKTDMTAEMDQADKTVQAERLKTLPAADGFHMPESLNHTKEPL